MTNIIDKYVNYIKDNPKKYWFKSKIYGYGWTPVKWQGWLITLLFLAYIISTATTISKTEPTNLELGIFFAKLFISLTIVIIICIIKGETPHWSWGLKKK